MEILHTYQSMADRGAFIIMLTVAVMIIMLFFGLSFLDEKKVKQAVVSGLIILSILFALIFNFQKLPRETFHEVNLDTLTEFDYRNYEIVSQKGKIVTLREVKLIK